jgi:hypothetical protein
LPAHLDIVLRKLIPKLQAFSQGIQETSMVWFYSSIHADDEMLIRQMSGDGASHGFPQIAAAYRTKTECFGSVPDLPKLNPVRVRNSLFLAQGDDIWGWSCGNATALTGLFLHLFGWQNLLNTDLIYKVFAFQVGEVRSLFVVGQMRP